MKRIPSKIAIQSILYLLYGKQHIRIMDYSNEYEVSNDFTPDWSNGKVVYDGLASDIYSASVCSMEVTRAKKSKCHGVKSWIDPETKESIMLFKIYTAFEQY